MKREPPGIRAVYFGYDLLWRAAIPLLRRNRRLSDGFRSRLGTPPPSRASLWIQAASVGEAYLAREIMVRLNLGIHPLRVLLTANTRQGLEIHRETADLPLIRSRGLSTSAGFFPFDRPAIMRQVVRHVRPTVAVFLETEIWPGLLRELRRWGSRIFIINGRLSPRSLERYLLWPTIWAHAAPDEVLAVSEEDAVRFQRLFARSRIRILPNIKFDRLAPPQTVTSKEKGAPTPQRPHFAVLGSVRREEENDAARMIQHILAAVPDAVVGLFPRHLHRVGPWRNRLNRMGIPWILRSAAPGPCPETAHGVAVVLWDTVGELTSAYGRARAAFVGGSLAPLGGQNFIEPLTVGVIPVIGPSWEDFRWVGEALFNSGLARIGGDWRAVADHLIQDLNHPISRKEVMSLAEEYISARKGGASQACRRIAEALGTSAALHHRRRLQATAPRFSR